MKIRLLLAFLLVSAAAFAWMDPAWQYRAPIAINNSGSALADYQVAVNTTNLVYNNSGLVGSWHFSEGSGNRTGDSSGLGNGGTYRGSSLSFDGVDDYVNVTDSASLRITGDISVEAWIRKNTVSDDKGFAIFKSPSAGNNRFSYALTYGRDTSGGGLAVSGKINFFVYDHLNDKLGYVYGYAYDTKQHHVVATWNATTKTGNLFVDGVDVGATTGAEAGFVSTSTGTDPLIFGRGRGHVSYPQDYFDGIIDEVRIYNRTLGAAEAAEHKQGIFGNNAGLVGYWSMKDGGTSQTVTDSSGIGNNGVRGSSSAAESSDPAWSTETAALWTTGKFGNGLNFNGLDDRVSVGMLSSAALNENSAYSISAWVNSNDVTGAYAQVIAGNYMGEAGGVNSFSTWLAVNTAGNLVFGINKRQIADSSISTPFSEGWQLVTATYDGSNLLLYVNGTLRNSTVRSFSGSTDNTRGWYLGDFSPESDAVHGHNSVLNGALDEVRVYNRAISAAEISARYGAGKLRLDYQDLRFATPSYTIYEMPLAVSGALPNASDYMAQVNVTDAAAIAHMRADGKDIRVFPSQVADPYGAQGPMNFWVEGINSTQVTLRVKADSTGTAYLYYGNPLASGVTNDGDLSVSGAYYMDSVKTGLAASVGAGSTSLSLSSSAGFGAGDEILVIDMQGTQADYGAVGTYETVTVFNVSGNALALNQPLRNAYNASHKVMVQRVPRFRSVVVNGGGAITANAWDGSMGGVVFFRAGSLTINGGGRIDVVAKGYRGGAGRTSVPAGQGESIGGTGTYSTNNNLGGGGGGGPYVSCCSSGGAGGGYATAGERGDNGNPNGAGGIAYGNETLVKLYLGSGGGGGEWYAGGSNGAAGSGIIAVIAGSVTNNGVINATGEKAWQGSGTVIQGGGGAGGSILLVAETMALGSNKTVADKGTESYFGMGDGSVGRIRIDYATAAGYTYPVSYNSTLSGGLSISAGAETAKSQVGGTALPYWLESDSRAWVRVPYVPNGASTIYAYYGNPNAQSAGSGNATFNVFEDFFQDGTNPPAGWARMGTAAWDASNFYMDNNNAGNQQKITYKGGQTLTSAEWQWKYYAYGNSYQITKFLGTTAAGTGGSHQELNAWSVYNDFNGNAYLMHGTGSNYDYVAFSGLAVNSWGYIQVRHVDGGGWNVDVSSDGRVWVNKLSNVMSSYTVMSNPVVFGAQEHNTNNYGRIDDIRVRKYSATEPSLSLQQEELQSPALFVGISPSSKTTYPAYNETFALWVYNNQTGSDTFTISCAGACSVSPAHLALTPYQNGSATVTITSANVSGTTQYTITAASQSNTSNFATISVSLTADTTKWRSTWSDAYGNEFKYRVPITLNNAGSALTDYQVNVTLDTATPIGLGRMRSDCGDLRFTNGTNEMPYWIEGGCNTTSTKIWARVPYVPAGTSAIYAYYGSTGIANKSNGTATFLFFDDFNRANGALGNGWTQYSGSAQVYSNFARLRTTSVDAWAYNPGPGDANNIVITEDVRILEASQGRAVSFVRASSTGNWISDGYGFYYGQGVVYIYDNGASKNSTAITMPVGTWYRMEMRIAPNNAIEVRLWQNGTARPSSPTVSWSGTPASPGANLKISGAGNYNTDNSDVDNYYIRRYASAEPSVSAASEQARGYRTLVRRCGMKQENATVTAYQGLNVSGSCLSDQYGICSLEISSGTYDLQFTFADNSTAWKNGTVFG